MTRTEITADLTTIFRDIFDDDTLVLSDDMTAGDVPLWDSLHHLVLIATVESTFGMKFRTTEIERLTAVGDLVDTVERRVR